GSALGGAGGAAVASDKRNRTESAIGGGVGGVGGYALGKQMGGSTGGLIGSALGAAGGAALGNKIAKDKDDDRRYYNSRQWNKKYRRHR
ncbi:glycine zipper domain-containing protein, partial [Klebsiella pneumoniae]|uniref:glycine zipper domain-containing protein n=1 Tax=Klebsiella pneumoniae TaxID=573 RepID=UPI002A1EDF7E